MNVYRFGDKVAITPPDGSGEREFSPTFYLSKEQGDALLFALMNVGEDITRLPFTKSQAGTTRIETTGKRYD